MHRNARLTPQGRLLLCQRIESGWPVAHAAAAMGISRDRAYVWWHRYQDEGPLGLEDRSSRPHRCPNRTKASVERRIVTLRTSRGLGPARIAGIVDQHPSTVHRVLVRHKLNRLDHLDRMTRAPIRRFEMSRPGELVHVDIKKLGRIPRGGGWRAHGRAVTRGQHHRTKVGYAFVHTAIDGYSRLAYSEVLDDEQGIDRRRLLEPRRGILRRARHPSRTGADRQRLVLSITRLLQRPSGRPVTASPGPTDPRPTAKRNASTGHFWPNGPMSEPGRQRGNGTGGLPIGFTSTTIIVTTPPSEAHRSVRVGNVSGHYS